MGERGRPRDLYDIVLLARRLDVGAHAQLIRDTLIAKCNAKGVEVPTLESVTGSPSRAGLESEWENMLGHQLPVLPPFEHVWGALPKLFAWLEGSARRQELEPIPAGADEDLAWSPPPLVATWGIRASLESIRFAAANHLCVRLGYGDSTREIEPYSLRRTKAGNLLLHARKLPRGENRAYRVDRIQSVRVAQRPFKPRFPVELSAEGPLITPPSRHRRQTGRRPTQSGPAHEIQCPMCQRTFRRKKRSPTLRPHKDRYGLPCAGRKGFLVGFR